MNKHNRDTSRQYTRPHKLQRQKRKSTSLEKLFLTPVTLCASLMLGISLSILNPESGPLANLKILLITCSAGLVAYGVNFFAITRGAPLAAIGYVWSGIASVVGILTVGIGMFIGSYSGLVYKSVEERVLIDNGAALNAYIHEIDQTALIIKRAGPALRLVSDDLANYAECERTSSCLSRNGRGGFGPVAAETQKLSQRSDGIAKAFDEGETAHQTLLKDINRLNRRYQASLSDKNQNLTEKRASLQGIHSELTQVSMALSEALPVSLFKSYTQELLNGVSIAGQRDSTSTLNGILRQHGETLSRILDEWDEDAQEAPAFPSPPGMIGALHYIADFAAFAAVIFVAELLLPITLWVLTYQKYVWEIEQVTPQPERQETHTLLGGFITLPEKDKLPPRHTRQYHQRLNGQGKTS